MGQAYGPATLRENAHMDVDQAIEIVQKLADGVDPTTGAIWARLEKVGRIQRKDFAGSTPYPPRTGSRPIEEPSRDPGGKDDPLPF